MIDEEVRLRELFNQSEEQSIRQNCLQASIFGAVFMLVGVSLDLVVYPEMVGEIFVNRSITAILLVAFGLTTKLPVNSVIMRVVLHIVAILPLASISYMIYQTEGAQSPYYSGLNLVLVGATLLLRWTTLDSALNVVFCLITYGWALRVHGNSWSEAFIPGYFIFVTGAIVSTGTYFFNLGRFREFCLSLEVSDANEKLEVTNEKLRALDETKSRFFANLSHELRTPLTLILGPAENLRRMVSAKSDPIAEEYLDTIEENGYRLLRLINDILDLVKLDSDESPSHPETIDVRRFGARMVSNLKPVASLKGVDISCESEVPEGFCVWLDRDRLEKIILNISINAIKFTSKGGSIKLLSVITNGQLQFSVSDTGQGMSQEDADNVFVRFWQADMSAKRKHRGAGIGLSLVKSLTESMEGAVRVESELGKGTTFEITLPITEPPADAELADNSNESVDVLERFNEEAITRTDRLSAAQSAATDERDLERVGQSVEIKARSERKLVLVADDEEAMRHFITRQMSDYDLVEARDGIEAWEQAQRHQPDLIILDLMMPGLDGVEVTRKIRANSNLSRVPVILVTAQASESPRLEALEAGVNDFISKPFSTVELSVRAKNLLNSSEFEVQLSENNERLESAYGQLKKQESLLVQTEKLSSLGRMSAGIVHEVNNPLNYTKTALHALETFKSVLPEDERVDYLDVLGDAREGVQRVIGIISDLRSFTRGDSLQTVDLLLTDVVESARRLTSSVMAGMEFIVESDEDVRIEGNEGQLCQVLVNFFQNSIRAIELKGKEPKAGKIKVTVRREADNGVSLLVWDNGCGVPHEIQQQIFDPFFTQNDVGEGMGLGLSICHSIIEQHQATVSVESEVGEYTQFTVIFRTSD